VLRVLVSWFVGFPIPDWCVEKFVPRRKALVKGESQIVNWPTNSFSKKISFNGFGTPYRSAYPYNAICVIHCVRSRKLPRCSNILQSRTRDALLAYSRMHVALSRSPFIASNKAQRAGLFYIAVSWTARWSIVEPRCRRHSETQN